MDHDDARIRFASALAADQGARYYSFAVSIALPRRGSVVWEGPLLPEPLEQRPPSPPGDHHRLAVRQRDFAGAVAERFRLFHGI